MSSYSFNKVFLLGRLGTAPEMRSTANQISVTTFSLATTESRPGQNGQRQETTEWHRIVVWGRMAEVCNQYLTKGSPVFIEGRLQTRSWDDKTGVKRYTTEIIASSIQFLPSTKSASANTGVNANTNNYNGSISNETSPLADDISSSQFTDLNMSDMGGAEDFGDIPF